MNETIHEKFAIREVIENWAIWRDAADWERFRTVWHEDGYMMATWFQAPFEDFIRMSKEGFDHGVNILHFLGGISVDLAGPRAIGQTKMTISQRGKVHDVLCDVVCTGRFYDFLEKRNGKWGIVHRQPIYEKDRLDPVDPAATLTLDRKLLDSFPEGYRHLAYLQARHRLQDKNGHARVKRTRSGGAVSAWKKVAGRRRHRALTLHPAPCITLRR